MAIMGGAAGRHNLAVGVVLSVIGGVLVGIALTIA